MTNKDEKILREHIENIAKNILGEMSSPRKSLDDIINEEVNRALLAEAAKKGSKKSKETNRNKKSVKTKEQKVRELLKNKPYTQAEVVRNALHKKYKLGSKKDNSDRSVYSKKIRGKRPFTSDEVNKLYNYLTNNMKK